MLPSQIQLPKDRHCTVPFPSLAHSMIKREAGHQQALRKHMLVPSCSDW